MTYRPDIDGLRALAILPVIFFHAGFGLFDSVIVAKELNKGISTISDIELIKFIYL